MILLSLRTYLSLFCLNRADRQTLFKHGADITTHATHDVSYTISKARLQFLPNFFPSELFMLKKNQIKKCFFEVDSTVTGHARRSVNSKGMSSL